MSTIEKALNQYLDGMQERSELLPGARDRILGDPRIARMPTPGHALEALADFLAEGGPGSHYRNPERKAPETPEAPLRAVLSRMVDGRSVEALYRSLAASMVGWSEGAMARQVHRYLSQREHHHYLRPEDRPGPDHREARMREVLEHFRHHLGPGVVDRIAYSWSRELGFRPAHELARVVAQRLQMPHWARELTRSGQPITVDWQDDAFRPAPAAEVDPPPVSNYRPL